MYSCSRQCYDYSNGHICKHIHRVHSLNSMIQPPDYQLEGEESTDSFKDELDDGPLYFAESTRDNSRGKTSLALHKMPHK